ncbi:MAG: amidase [Myxococcota bacterium]
MSELAFRTASELCERLRRGELKSRELLELQLERVAKHDPRVNAVITLEAARARARADAADRTFAQGRVLGPLHGLPITIKDSFETEGIRTTCGAPELRAHVPARDAVAVARLRAAGAIVFGKTNTPYMTGDWQTYNEVFGTTRNPWNLERTPGGSSGGAAAAVAAGFGALELGSDIGGSIRVPSHWSGVFGHKPSYGIIPQRGHIPFPPGSFAEADLNVHGPIGRSVEDLELGLDVLAGASDLESVGWRLELPKPRRATLADYRIAAWLDDADFPVDGEVKRVHAEAIEKLRSAGANVDEQARPKLGLLELSRAFRWLLMPVMTASLPAAARASLAQRVASAAPGDESEMLFSARATTASHHDWLVAHEQRERLRAEFAAFFSVYDALLLPVNSVAAIPHDQETPFPLRTITVNGAKRPYTDLFGWIAPASLCKLPATVLPAGRTRENLPVGLQIAGPYLEDRTALDLAKRVSAVLGGFTPPPGF